MSILSFFRNLFFEDVPETQISKKEIPLIEEAIIISCYFNPMKSPYRKLAFDKFFEGIKGYNHKIVECVIGDSVAELPDTFEKVYTKSLLWHKETLLNNIIKTLPAKYKYIFWVDADILFTNPTWLEEGIKVMKAGANMIQPFEYGIHLMKDELEPSFNVNAYRRTCSNPVLRHKQLWRSFCSNHPGLSGNNNYDAHGHVGFAWGIKREILDKVPGGLYDKALIGGADHIMAHAAAGQINHNCIAKSFTDDIDAVNQWSRTFYVAVEGKLGFVKGDVNHIWHGDLKDRQYLKRITEFTPATKRIHQRDANGLYIHDDVDDTNYMTQYFMMREILDDEVIIEEQPVYTDIYDNVVEQPIEFGGGQTDGGGAGGTWNDNQDAPIAEADLPGFIPNTDYQNDNTVSETNDGNDYSGSTFS